MYVTRADLLRDDAVYRNTVNVHYHLARAAIGRVFNVSISHAKNKVATGAYEVLASDIAKP